VLQVLLVALQRVLHPPVLRAVQALLPKVVQAEHLVPAQRAVCAVDRAVVRLPGP
jgi:hypothetical protein